MVGRSVLACVVLVALGARVAQAASEDWFKNSVVYQIYPRSFKDSNGDGIGDLNGITSKLEHIADIGATAFWLSPIYKSPQVDFGYDIANFTDIDPDYGTLADFDKLVAKAKSLGLKVILDFVPNHSSHEHPWFTKSIQKVKPYDDYYIWRDAKMIDGKRHPPNNWLSSFQGSAWEWNEQRGQYYFHQFATGQPDLNYRNKDLDREMKDALTFWMNRGVDGFRIDALNTLFEDEQLRDEPRKDNTENLPDTDPNTLEHIYTMNLNETYDVLASWRKLMDEHSKKNNEDVKMVLTEAYTSEDHIVRFYQAGSNVPFNFMFITDLGNQSTALDFKRSIDNELRLVPEGGFVANWVVGNHDQPRAASRFGRDRADQLNMLATLLPGVTVIYNGDEIGMENRPFTYEETVDPAGCNAGKERYHLTSRDPERTPYQWDGTTSAGFSTSSETWLPVHPNYKTLNLAAQKTATLSHYKIFKTLTAVKKHPTVRNGGLEVLLATENVLAVIRRRSRVDAAVLLVNCAATEVTVDAKVWLNIPQTMSVSVPSLYSNIKPGSKVDTSKITLPAAASVLLYGKF